MKKLILSFLIINSYVTIFSMDPDNPHRSLSIPIEEYRGYNARITKDPNGHYYGKVLEIPVTFHGCRKPAAIKHFKLNVDIWIAYREHHITTKKQS